MNLAEFRTFTLGGFGLAYALYLVTVLLIVLVYRANQKANTEKSYPRLYTVLLIVLGTYGYLGSDYINYQNILDLCSDTPWNFDLFFEWPYSYIASFINYNYSCFRLIVWGTAFLVLYILFKENKTFNYQYYFFFAILYLVQSITGRGFLASALFFCGVALLCKKSMLSIFLGVAFIVFSPCFHFSAVILFLTLPFMFIQLSKTKMILIIGLCIIAFWLVLPHLEFFIGKEEEYKNMTISPTNLFGAVYVIVRFYSMSILSCIILWKMPTSIMSVTEKFFFRILFMITAFTFSTFVYTGFSFSHLTLRVAGLLSLPVIFLLPRFVSILSYRGKFITSIYLWFYFVCQNFAIYISYKLFFL